MLYSNLALLSGELEEEQMDACWILLVLPLAGLLLFLDFFMEAVFTD